MAGSPPSRRSSDFDTRLESAMKQDSYLESLSLDGSRLRARMLSAPNARLATKGCTSNFSMAKGTT